MYYQIKSTPANGWLCYCALSYDESGNRSEFWEPQFTAHPETAFKFYSIEDARRYRDTLLNPAYKPYQIYAIESDK